MCREPSGRGPIHVVRADPRNPDLLYVGTEFGLFVSLDAGASWQPLGKGLPPVAVHDLVVHPRDRELVVATHGRSLYVIDVAPLQELTARVQTAKVHLFDVRTVKVPKPVAADPPPPRTYAGANPPEGAVIYYRLLEKQASVSLEVLTKAGDVVAKLPASAAPGLHAVRWKLNKAAAGDYQVRLRGRTDLHAETARGSGAGRRCGGMRSVPVSPYFRRIYELG